jgi:hypothetical protein
MARTSKSGRGAAAPGRLRARLDGPSSPRASSRLQVIAAALGVPVEVFYEELAGSRSQTTERIGADGLAAALLTAFSAIEDENVRRRLVALAEALAGPAPVMKN